MLAERWSGAVTRTFLLAALSASCLAMLSGCASMVSSKEELQDLGENEGIVFGSFLINVAKGEGKETASAFLRGPKAGDGPYLVRILEYWVPRGNWFLDNWGPGNPLQSGFAFSVAPETEQIFIKKLPAGFYKIESIQYRGLVSGKEPLIFGLEVYFTAVPKQTTYIGRTTVQLPYRIAPNSTVRTSVVDAQRQTTERLKNEHEKALSNVVNGLLTPLHDAAAAGALATAAELLGQNPRLVAARDLGGYTALHVAVATRQKDMAELLLAKGAGVNDRTNRDAVTPLHVAASSGHKDITALLLANGADVRAKNRIGQTPLVVADCSGRTEVATVLRAHSLKAENLTPAERQDLAKRSPC